MDILIHWQDTIYPGAMDRFDEVEALTCDGRIVTMVRPYDKFTFPLRVVREFQVLEEDGA